MEKYSKTLYKFFKKEGLLSRHVEGYQPRKAQFEMANKILQCLKKEEHGLIEAGTGTGKSFGYTLPAAIWALKKEKRIIISTNTITLQQQLMKKELPLVKEVLRDYSPEWGEEFRFELAKGRGNYICQRRLENLMKESLEEEQDYTPLLQKIKKRLSSMKNGDKEDFPFPIPSSLFQQINGDAEDCAGKSSPFYRDCYIQKARKKLQNAQIIVVNHALFFTDLVLRQQGANILPAYDAVIMDEAHRVEDQVTKQFTYHVSIGEIERLFFRYLNKRTPWARETQEPILRSQTQGIRTRLITQLNEFFAPFAKILAERPSNEYLVKKPFMMEFPFGEVFSQWKALFNEKKKEIELGEGDSETVTGIERYITQIDEAEHRLRHVLLRENPDQWATWVSYEDPKGNPQLKDDQWWANTLHLYSAPIEIHPLLRESLFKEKTVIMTSATLKTQGDFSFVAKRLGMDHYTSLDVKSPFNYEKQSMLLVPEDAPDPRDPQYESFLLGATKEILLATKGRTFLLFTSYSQMNRVYEEMQPWLQQQGMEGLLHRSDLSRESILQDFRQHHNRVLFGCDSFWEGVDVPGDDLICVVIAKLPFPVPSEPLTKARTEKMENEGKSSFFEYMLPLATLRLKQGFGRLIRTKKDRGMVIILDSRINRKKYGEQILDSLPQAQFTKNMDDVPLFFNKLAKKNARLK